MLYSKNYQPEVVYIITGPSNSGKTFLAKTILTGLLYGVQPSDKFINRVNLEDDRNTAHITINDDPTCAYMMIDKLNAHQITFKQNRDDLVELIMAHRPKYLILNGQDPDGQLVNQLLNNIGLKEFNTRVVKIDQ